MDIVVDANIIFAALIKDSLSAEILFHNGLKLFAPEFLLEEFYKHKKEILNKTKRTEQQFENIFEIIKQVINLIPKEEFKEFIEEASKISQDQYDVPYIALALKLRIPIWSNDKGLKKQKEVIVYSTQEIKEIVM